MPADFDACQKGGGKIRTIDVGNGKYAHVCILKGKTHMGEIREKATASKEDLMEIETIAPEQATAATKFTKLEIVSDGTKDGTTIKVNGKAIPNLSSMYFSFYDSTYCPLCIEYTTREKDTKPGELGSYTSYRLNPPAPAAANRAEASLAEGMTFVTEPLRYDANLIAHEPKKPNPYAQLGYAK